MQVIKRMMMIIMMITTIIIIITNLGKELQCYIKINLGENVEKMRTR